MGAARRSWRTTHSDWSEAPHTCPPISRTPLGATLEPEGFVVLERIDWFSPLAPGGARADRSPVVALTHDEVCTAYKGIEGNLWPELHESDNLDLLDGIALAPSEERVRRYVARVAGRLRISCVYLSGAERTDGLTASRRELPFLGFDFGFFTCGGDNYSVIFNEVIYGTEETLRRLGSFLNENLLFQSRHAIEVLRRERVRLLKAGRDLETDDHEPQAFKVFDPDIRF